MKERRKAQRKQTNEFFRIYNRANDEFIGKLIDLSIMGMRIQAVQNMDIGSIYQFRIDFPILITGKHHLAFDAECVWCRESTKSNGNYDIGFQITQKIFEKVETIQCLLNDSLFHDAEKQPRLTIAKKST